MPGLLYETPISTALARRAGLHPATVTGILDRLERDGWIVGERDQSDRRAIIVRALPERNAEMFAHCAARNGGVDDILAGYTPDQLELLVDFRERSVAASRAATGEFADTAE